MYKNHKLLVNSIILILLFISCSFNSRVQKICFSNQNLVIGANEKYVKSNFKGIKRDYESYNSIEYFFIEDSQTINQVEFINTIRFVIKDHKVEEIKTIFHLPKEITDEQEKIIIVNRFECIDYDGNNDIYIVDDIEYVFRRSKTNFLNVLSCSMKFTKK